MNEAGIGIGVQNDVGLFGKEWRLPTVLYEALKIPGFPVELYRDGNALEYTHIVSG